MSDPIDLTKPHRSIRVGVILMNSKTEILDIASVDIFTELSKEFFNTYPSHLVSDEMRDQALEIESYWVNESGEGALLTAGATVKPTHTFATCPPLDIILMGANDPSYALSEAEIKFIQKCNQESQALLFVCGGFACGLQAGLLNGKTATAPRPMVDHLRQAYPDVKWVAKRWARDGKIWTSGALLNGTDMAKAFALDTWGGGEGSFVEFGMRFCGYPYRDVDYADVPWTI